MDLFRWIKNACGGNRRPVAHIPDTPHTQPVRRRYRFSGRVQGVGFRYEAKGIAAQLSLVGWVRNQSDGSVVVEIEGAANYIEAFLLGIYAVPRFDITDVQTEDLPPLKNETAFRILY